ncbi:MAG TPA: NUDIX domain-containing protein, partial [Flavisolibacter sp.]
YFNELATKLLPPHDASAFNQAIMDFGATVCRPVPECNRCFFSRNCVAYLRGTQHQFPVKKKKPVTATRWLNYIVVRNRNYVAVRQRTGSDIWNQLHEFVLIETPGLREASHVIDMFRQQFGVQQVTLEKSIQKTQKLTHQKLYLQFNVVTLTTRPAWPDFAWVDTRKLDEQAFPVTLKRFIADHLA